MGKKEVEHEEEQLDEIHEELAELKEQVEQFDNKYKRALADYQNLEKRVAGERSEWMQSANRDLLMRLLPVLDTLMMAIAHSEDQALHITINQFLDALRQEGVTKIETKGKTFDPNLMEAIATGDGEEGKVLEELRAGYRLYEKVLRPAQVKVGKADSSK